MIKKHLHGGQKKITLNKTKVFTSKSERICLVKNTAKLSDFICSETTQTSIRRTTYSFDDKENLPNFPSNMFSQETIITSPDRSSKQPGINCHDFKIEKINSCLTNQDLLDKGQKKSVTINSLFDNNFCLTPLKSTENLLSPFSSADISKSATSNKNLTVTITPFKPINTSTAAKIYSPEEKNPRKVSVNLCTRFKNKTVSELDYTSIHLETIDSKSSILPQKYDQSFDLERQFKWTPIRHSGKI